MSENILARVPHLGPGCPHPKSHPHHASKAGGSHVWYCSKKALASFRLNQGAKVSLVSISRRERYTSLPNGHPQETLTPVYRNLHSIDVGGFADVVDPLA